MKPSTAFTAFAASYFVLVLAKDGTLTKLVSNAATFINTGVKGLTPLTKIG